MKKIWTKALAYVLAVTMCLSAVHVPVYAQEREVTEVTAETEIETVAESTAGEVVSTEKISMCVKMGFCG